LKNFLNIKTNKMYFLLEKEILIYDKCDWSVFIDVAWNNN